MKLENAPPSLSEKLKQLKGLAVQDHKVVHVSPKYIVIGNFITQEDSLTVQVFNEASGLTDDVFSFAVENFANLQGLPIKERFGDSVVVEGGVTDLGLIKQALGYNFSYAHVDDESLEALIQAEDDFQKHGRRIPGSQKPKVEGVQLPRFDS